MRSAGVRFSKNSRSAFASSSQERQIFTVMSLRFIEEYFIIWVPSFPRLGVTKFGQCRWSRPRGISRGQCSHTRSGRNLLFVGGSFKLPLESIRRLNEPPRRCELIVIRRYSPPCTTARRGGCVIKENLAKPPKQTQPGWFSFLDPSENHPGLAISGCFAIFSESLGHPSLQ